MDNKQRFIVENMYKIHRVQIKWHEKNQLENKHEVPKSITVEDVETKKAGRANV